MISLLDGMPLVRLRDGRNTAFDKRWITAAIRAAAEHAGYHRWHLAEEIAESVSSYLRRDFTANFVEIPNISEAILGVLASLGFRDVADFFHLPDPPVRLSLDELAREAGDGYELAFFGLLESRLRNIAESDAVRLEIRDLSPCLRLLSTKRRKQRDGLRGEIIEFIRRFGCMAGSHRGAEPLEIRVS